MTARDTQSVFVAVRCHGSAVCQERCGESDEIHTRSRSRVCPPSSPTHVNYCIVWTVRMRHSLSAVNDSFEASDKLYRG